MGCLKKKVVILFSALVLMAAVLSGCVNVDMDLKDNGSCDLKYLIDNGTSMNFNDVQNHIKKQVDEANKKAGKEIIKIESLNDRNGKVEASFSVKDLNDLNSFSFFGSYKDFRKKYPDRVTEVKDASKGEKLKVSDIKEIKDTRVLLLSLSDLGVSGLLTELKVSMPDKVLFTSVNVKMVDEDTVRCTTGDIFVAVEGKTNYTVIVLVLVLLALVGGGFYYFKRKSSFKGDITGMVGEDITERKDF